MNSEMIIAFIGSSILLTLMPGPDNTYVLLESVTGGVRRGIAFASGLVTGIIFHTILVATGVAYLISHSDIAYNSIKYFGAAYLLYLAYLAYRETKPDLSEADKKTKYSKLYLKGLVMNISNPKVLLFFIAYLPQFITKDGMEIKYQIFILGVIFLVQAYIIMSSIAILSGKLKAFIKNENFWKYVKYIKIVVLFALAVFIIL
ncbi:MAG TPA: LysE family translocator [Bacteroidetes bacterium]|nr:LysE family translocator [Bacteroidota bacterium]